VSKKKNEAKEKKSFFCSAPASLSATAASTHTTATNGMLFIAL